MFFLRKIWNTIVPYKIRKMINLGMLIGAEDLNYKSKIGAVDAKYADCEDEEIQKTLAYIHKRKRIYYFNGKWCNKYLAEKIKVFYEDDFPYVVIDGKRIYFPKNRSEDSVVDEMRRLLLEQDKESPHCYLSSNFQVKEGDVVFDCGTAEGNFAISVVDKVKKMVLFECEDEWIECLNKTFKDYKDKVIIQKKFVSNFTDDKNISIIDFSKKENLYPDFIKMDIEGAEIDAVDRIGEIIKEKPNLKMAICTYHRADDYDNLLKKLSGTFDIETSKGYMLLRDKIENPYFARGLIRCTGKK